MTDSSPTPASPSPRDAAIRSLCAAFFNDPARLKVTLTHRIEQRFDIAPHRHDDLLQFDLLIDCAGRAKVDDTWTDISGMTALVAPPHTEHGYQLKPAGPHARVYHFRLAMDEAGPDVFPRLVTALPTNPALASAMRVVIRLGAVESARPPLLFARLAEVLCLWPSDEEREPDAPDDTPEEEARGLELALELLEQRIADPPPLEELAEVAHFSVRHFTRRFQSAFGCTPHAYLTARRFALSKQLLSQERLQVGQIAEQLGFGSVATFSRWFSQQAGQPPTAFRDNAEVM